MNELTKLPSWIGASLKDLEKFENLFRANCFPHADTSLSASNNDLACLPSSFRNLTKLCRFDFRLSKLFF
jgi:hypothetical protein